MENMKGETLFAYNFGNIFKIERLSLSLISNCTQLKENSDTLKSGELMFKPVPSEVSLKFCMYLASYSVKALKKSSWWDDATYLLEYSKLIPTFYPLSESENERLWDTIQVQIPGFGNEDNTIPLEKVDSILVSETTNNFKVNLSKTFVEKGSIRGVKYVHPVEWISPTNKKLWVQF